MFIPLHVKSDYSLGYGTASIEELVERASRLGYPALALTDIENLYGQVRFHRQCREYGIRPITGIELRSGFDLRQGVGSRHGRMVLLARNDTGYRSLCHIVARRRGAVGESKEKADDPVALLLKHREGLFALSDDPAALARLVAGGFPRPMAGLLIVRPGTDEEPAPRVEAARRLGIRAVADLDCLLLDPADHPLHLLQLAIRTGTALREMEMAAEAESVDRLLISPEAADVLFHDLPAAVAAAEEIAATCSFDLIQELAPRSDLLSEEANALQLRQLCSRAISLREAPEPAWLQVHRVRLDQELATFAALGFSRFMLQVAEILGYCRDNGIPTAVRGSAVSSLVIHLLGGSPVDPIAEGLLFERFLHPGKSSWPDVDLDLPWHRRDEVIDFVYRHFGHDHVAMVAAHHSFRYRSALREGLKAWGARPALIESLSRALPPEELEPQEVDFLDLAAQLPEETAAEDPLRRYEKAPMLTEILPLVRRLVGRPHHLAVHPGGVLIERFPLRDRLPLERAPKGVVITQYDSVAVAELGLVKIDLLGNRCLSELEETLRLAQAEPCSLAALPREDPATLELIDRADTLGCFQLESPAMRVLLARLPIRSSSDLTAALALIRPGAASGEVKRSFVRRARGEERALPVFPALADRTATTQGLLLYEEDVMELLSRTGGVSLAEADELRRGIVRSGGDAEVLAELQRRFLEQLPEEAGEQGRARARRAWLTAARFAAYSFNKAHAASYARLAYYSAYCKVHYPLQFACALLNHHQGLYPLRVEANDLQRMGVRLSLPEVNRSSYSCGLEMSQGTAATVRIGLAKVKGLSRRAALELIEVREDGGPFLSLRDLLERVPLIIRDVTALVFSGACDRLPPLTRQGYPFLHETVLKRFREGAPLDDLDRLHLTLPPLSDADRQRVTLYQSLTRVRNELIHLEMSVTAHPMRLLRPEARRCRCLTVAQATARPAGEPVRLAAVMAAMRRVPIREGILQYVTLEDETGLLEGVVLPQRYRLMGERVTTPGPFLVEGILQRQQEVPFLEVIRLDPFHEREEPYGTR
ncbi:PHP domain-containing protein [Geomesophilobacter sediminis]|uniref:DNA-directed DNA polymerase n=1 Tax=Geomesophilobacter sediminis TaxID=2798584 RepID=A0A8J7LWM5_9BACT|nr:PHP domain-containing protein [Geomesophilobacter sediminis]MBJ6725995.1 DNA polymerase III subunit alpha [Geomesophilobacter sediminis]